MPTKTLTPEDQKFLAEAAAADAKAQRDIAEADLRSAEARRERANADVAELNYEHALIELEHSREAERNRKASDDQHHVYQFSDAVTASSVKTAVSRLSLWRRVNPGCDIEIVFNSPGGSVIDGFALWDFLTELKRDRHHITTVCRGMAASMAGILLQAGNRRVMGAESVLLVHEISFGAGGKIGEVEDEVAFAKMLTQRVLKIFAARTKLSAAQIDRRWKRKDWWMDSDEALKLGFCDEIR